METKLIQEGVFTGCEAMLDMDILKENDFLELYGTSIEEILASDSLFVNTHYITFDDESTKLLFLHKYLKSIKDSGEYTTFFDFIAKWEKGNACQKLINQAKISLSLGLTDVVQGNKLLRDIGDVTLN